MRLPASLLSMLFLGGFLSTATAQNGRWVTYTTSNSGLVSDTISSIAFDANHNVWMGTHFGLDQWDGGTMWKSYYNDFVHVPSNTIYDLAYSNGSLWIGNGVGVTEFDGNSWNTYTSSNSGLVAGTITCLLPDISGNLWIGTARGLSQLKTDNSWATYTVSNTPSMPYNGIAALTTNGDANLWMAFIGTRGFVEFPNGSSSVAKFIKMDTISQYPSGYVTSLATDGGGNLWVGTQNKGLVEVRPSGAVIYSRATTSVIKNDTIHKVAFDQCGHPWIATDAGVATFNDGVWTAFTHSSGQLPNDVVNTIAVDPAGHVWFGTRGGMAEFKPLPEKPILAEPPNATTIVMDSVTCRWAWDCPGILKYWHEIADNPNFTNSIVDTTSASLTESASKWDTILNDNTTYYWRVKAENDAGWGPFSNTWTFNIAKAAVDVSEHSKAGLTAFPNPATDKLEVLAGPQGMLRLYDLMGRERLHASCDGGGTTLNISGLEPGAYFLRIEDQSVKITIVP